MNDNSKQKTIIIAITCVVIVLIVCVSVTVALVSMTAIKSGNGSKTQEAVVSSVEDKDDEQEETEKKDSEETEAYREYNKKENPTTKATTAYQPPQSASIYSDSEFFAREYLFPSDTTYLTSDILSHYTREQILYITNEMYARHGYIFKVERFRTYFSSKSWYYGTETSMDVVVKRFNSVENANLDTIVAYEKAMGWR